MISTIIKKYIWIPNLIILLLIAYVSASLVNTRIGNKVYSSADIIADGESRNTFEQYAYLDREVPPRDYYDAILARNIFGADPDRAEATEAEEDTEAPETELNLELLGTYLSSETGSMAIIKNVDTGKVSGYGDGETVDIFTDESIKIVSIGNCSAVIERERVGTETIECKKDIEVASSPAEQHRTARRSIRDRIQRDTHDAEEAEGIRLIDDNKWLIERKMLDELLDDPGALINQARVVPQQDGMRFFGIRPTSIFYKIGLRNGDTIHRINNVELNDVENALGVFGELKNQSQFQIDFTRRGSKHTYEYTVN